MTILVICLVISLLINVVSIHYSITCARKLIVVANNLFSIKDEMEVFRGHVEAIHETEMYYGDTTLQGLIEHTKDMLAEIDKYEDIFTLIVEEENTEELEFEEDTEEETEEN